MTKPYGWKLMLWTDENYGPQTKHTGSGYKGRHRERQLLHKMGRRQGRDEIDSQLAEMDEPEMFVCRACGWLLPVEYGDHKTGECVYC